MRVLGSVAAFVLVTVALFVWFGRVVPQSAPGQEKPITIGESPEDLVAAGRTLLERENSCLTCHSVGEDPKARCPNLEGVWTRAANRKPGTGALEYLVESVYDPNAYIVEGFPKNQMKPVNRPPIALSDGEIKAVLCYLVSLSEEPDAATVKAIDAAQEPYASGRLVAPQEESGFALLEGDAGDGEFTFEEMQCFKCHAVLGKGGGDGDSTNVGPDLSSIGAIQSRAYLAESIMNPNAVIVKGEGYARPDSTSRMPEYHDTMTLREFVDLVAFLETLKGEASSP